MTKPMFIFGYFCINSKVFLNFFYQVTMPWFVAKGWPCSEVDQKAWESFFAICNGHPFSDNALISAFSQCNDKFVLTQAKKVGQSPQRC